PVAAPDPGQLRQLIADLDSADFVVRHKANNRLEKLGELAGPALRKVTKDKSLSLEAQRRIERLLARIDELAMPADTPRQWRAIETLEAIGNLASSRQILQALATGPAGARITQGAADALKRMQRLDRVRGTTP